MMSSPESALPEPRSPAFAAGLPVTTCTTSTPLDLGSESESASDWVMVWPLIPSQGCCTALPASSVEMTRLAVLMGTAKPTPTLPWTGLWIDSSTPRTSPLAFSSGPPELPGLMGASVWIMPVNARPLGAVLLRPRPETMPEVSEPASPNGVPMASTGSPIWAASELASTSGCRWLPAPETWTTARSSEASVPATAPATVVPSLKVTRICRAPATTCSLVRMSPPLLSTIPEPVASPTLRKLALSSVTMTTTPGDVCW